MKTTYLVHLVLALGWASGLAQTPPSGLVNGSFEDGFNGWPPSGNVSVESAPVYSPMDGTHLVAFNAVDVLPNGSIRQTLEIANSTSYFERLRFNVGSHGVSSNEMRLRVQISQTYAQDNPVPLVDEVISVPANSGGTTHWQEATCQFRTPETGEATITLTDVSVQTHAADLVVDHLRMDTSVYLGVNTSEDSHTAGVTLTASPADLWGTTDLMWPNRNLSYFTDIPVILSAPATANGKPFLRWLKNGVDYDTNPVTVVTSTAGLTMTALYDPPVELRFDVPAEARSFVGTGPIAPLAWRGEVWNNTGLNPQWAASAAVPDGSPNPVFFKVTPTYGVSGSTNSSVSVCLTAKALQLPAGVHRGLIRIHSGFGIAETELTLTVVDPSRHLSNGSFESESESGQARSLNDYDTRCCESGFEGWQATGNVCVQSGPLYVPSDGMKLATFNAGDSTPNGVISRTIPTEPGVSYLLYFHMGTLSFNTKTQTLDIKVLDARDPAAPSVKQVAYTLTGVGGGDCSWTPNFESFVAQSDLTTIVFSDLSSATKSIDLLLDNVYVLNENFGLRVTTLADENDATPGTGSGDSLREVIAAVGGIPGSHAITFAPQLDNGVIALGGTQLATTGPLAIDASALPSGITIDAGGQTRVIELGSDTTLQNLRIENGNTTSTVGDQSGGGILNHGNLMLSGVTLANNTSPALAGGISTYGVLSASGCRFTANHAGTSGGALYNSGSTALLESSLINGNSADVDGGALADIGGYGTALLMLSRCTVSDNSAGRSGGGYCGLRRHYRDIGNLIAENSTFSGNTAIASGGAIHVQGILDLRSCTVSGNSATGPSAVGGGISDLYYDYLQNSIVAGNTAATLPDIAPDILTSPNAADHNLVSGNPQLAPLGDYGGFTPTMPPLPGSPAIDAAVMLDVPPTIDQIGGIRPRGPLPDLGAVEAFPFSSLVMIDSDHDGIDDRLEPAYQMIVGENDSGHDTDGDGSRDGMELANMTDPLNSNSLLKIVSFNRAVGFESAAPPVFDVTFSSFPGLSYSLECDQSLQFHSPSARVLDYGAADGFTSTLRMELMPERDFVRVRRNP